MAYTQIDRDLLRRCLTNEPGAWRAFVDRFVGLFVHVVNHTASSRSVPLNQDDTDDLCAEVFLALVKDDYAVLRRFRGESSLATYLTVVARRVIVNSISSRRKAKAMGHVSTYAAGQSGIYNTKESGTNGQDRIDDAEEVQKMLDGLPKQEAEIVRQYHLEGKSYREISEALKIPENSIGPTLSRARAKLREKKPAAAKT